MHISPDTASRLIDVNNLAKRLDLSTRTLYRMLQRGHLPQPVRMGSRTVRWRLADVLAYVEGLEARQPGVSAGQSTQQAADDQADVRQPVH